jgi:hypothetical protein
MSLIFTFESIDQSVTNSAGVHVPGIRMVDAFEDLLGIEWIEGNNVRSLLPGGENDEGEREVKDDISETGSDCFQSGESEASLNLEGTENPLSEYGTSPGEQYDLKSSPPLLKHRKKKL